MRHFYKSHGKHCYLRSFPMVCKKCGANVLYWECTHGSKIFFEYPPYGKLLRHTCRKAGGLFKKKNNFPIVVKTPIGLLGEPYNSCAVCGKKFRDESSLKDHINEQRKFDLEHKIFFSNKPTFQNGNKPMNNANTDHTKVQHKPKFGRINIKMSKDE
ncbi:MAG: hypothetical protein KGD67_07630 [Candidatus Lokiarchaeota archaeon]|nr:hypothetical protein [Candidatus Lokiarchaeota archaeon]